MNEFVYAYCVMPSVGLFVALAIFSVVSAICVATIERVAPGTFIGEEE